MNKKLRILHTGDFHLDSPFAGLDAEASAIRRRELRETFCAMMEYARTADIDMVLIAGDLFDRRFATSETLSLICTNFASLPCPVVITPGNHDPADGRGIWHSTVLPGNVFVFREDKLRRLNFPELGVDVYGYAFTSPEMTGSPVAGEFIKDKRNINILLCHADILSPVSSSAPLSRAQIEAFGADYTALGHIHNGEDYSGEAGGFTYAYCGCPEGRDFGECGIKGAVIAEITADGENHTVTLTRKSFCRKKYEDITVAVDGAVTMSDINSAISGVAAGISMKEQTLLRVTLTGAVDPELVIDSSYIETILSDFSKVVVRDRTSPSLSFSEDDPTVRGEFCRLLAPMLGSADPAEREIAIKALRFGLTVLSGNDI